MHVDPLRRTVVVIIAVSLAPMAWGQVQSGQSGQALDANQQVGAGGYNQPSLQVDYRSRNDLITGNVSGGRAFQDDVGYGSPGAFGLEQVPLAGGNEVQVFRFRRDSLPSSPRFLAGSRVGAGSVPGSFVGVFSTFNSLPAYRTGNQIVNPDLLLGGRQLQVIAPSPVRGGSIISSDIIPDTYSTAGGPFRQGNPYDVTRDPLQQRRRPDGSALQVQASPLLGVRQYLRSTDPAFSAANPFGIIPDDDEDQPRPDELDLSSQSQLNVEGYRISSGLGTTGVYADRPAKVAPGLIIGKQLQMQLMPALPDETIDQRVQRLESAIYSPLGSYSAEPGQDVYLDLLDAMRNRGQVDEPKSPTATEQTQDEQLPGFAAGMSTPSDQQIQDAEQLRLEALRKVYGLETEADRQAEEDQMAETGEDEPADTDEQGRIGMDALVKQLNYDLPRLDTLAGRRQTRVNETLRKAEADLAAGRYFSAEGRYRQALTDEPGDPLIRAGLVNAQLGAGMIRSAAHNLRILCTEHPELIAARYGENLLPAGDRLKWVQGELQNTINDPASSADPGLMMAYLGYQVGSRQLIRYGLAIAEARAPSDPLFPLLRSIWLDESRTSLDGAIK